MLCQIIPIIPSPDAAWHNLFFYKIWGEIGNKLGGKDINKTIVIYLEKK
jgi:hypothetical protein